MASVIRRESFSSTPAFSFEDLASEARAMVERAEARAQQTLCDAEARARSVAERLEQEGYQHGLKQGRRDGFEQVRQEARQAAFEEARGEIKALSDALSAGLAAFEQSKRHLLAAAESQLIELALAVARRVCKRLTASSSDAARANARHVLELVKHESDLVLRVNPAEYEALRELVADLVQDSERHEHLEVVADPQVERGGCLLTSREGTIDASIDTQLERIAEALCRPAEGHQPDTGEPG